MAHFAIIAPPLRGHYAPLSNLAAELIARGHRATFIQQEDARPLVEVGDASFAAIGALEAPVDTWTRPMSKIRGIAGLGGTMRRMERFTAMFCREAPDVLRKLGVDIIIADQLEPAGGLLAEHLRLPWISVATTIPMNRENCVPPPFVGWRYDPTERGLRRNAGGWLVTDLLLRSFNRVIERNAAMLGLPRRARIEDCFSPLLQLAQFVPSLDFPRRNLAPHFHYTGPFRRRTDPPFEVPRSSKPTVFASLGTLQGSRVRLFQKLAEACDQLGLRLIITHGGLARNSALGKLPGDTIVYDWIPYEAALASADLVVCHGGANAVLDSLSAGLPMVVIPLAFEQPGIAARVSYAGAGLTISRRASVRSFVKAFARIRDEASFRFRAQALADELSRAGGVSRAANLIEHALGASARPAIPTRAHAGQGGAHGDSRNGSRS